MRSPSSFSGLNLRPSVTSFLTSDRGSTRGAGLDFGLFLDGLGFGKVDIVG